MMLRVVLSLAAAASQAVAIGINLGNVLEAPVEGAWAPAAEEFYFDDYTSRGFGLVRVPVRWDQHMSRTAPYAIDQVFLARVQTVVGWGLSRNLTVIVNSHHDDWIDDADTFSAMRPRFLALWTQVAAAFSSASASLRFEVLNEPVKLTIAQLNDLYGAVVPIMRAANPTRVIYLGGLSWMSPLWIVKNPEALKWPALASGARDPNLRLEVHAYDPFTFCLQSPPTASSWGTPADIAALRAVYANISAWGAAHGRGVLMGEAGCQVAAPSRPDRLAWYATVAAAAREFLSDGIAVWDDYGTWKIYSRAQTHAWDEGVMTALGLPASADEK